MPGRITPLVTGEIYHVFNRGIDRRPTFTDVREYSRAQRNIEFYRFAHPPTRFSFFLTWAAGRRKEILSNLEKSSERLIDILSYCLMPNHFHLLLKQKTEGGISKFMSNFQNSFTRYFNTKHRRIGPLFLDQFKAVRIETDEQLLHVWRYILLNPYSSFVVKTLRQLKTYRWSSFPQLLENENGFCTTDDFTAHFRTGSDLQKFIFDQADYQRQLEEVKHLLLEDNPK